MLLNFISCTIRYLVSFLSLLLLKLLIASAPPPPSAPPPARWSTPGTASIPGMTSKCPVLETWMRTQEIFRQMLHPPLRRASAWWRWSLCRAVVLQIFFVWWHCWPGTLWWSRWSPGTGLPTAAAVMCAWTAGRSDTGGDRWRRREASIHWKLEPPGLHQCGQLKHKWA